LPLARLESLDINASSSSFAFVVEKYDVFTEFVDEERFPETVWSIARGLPAVCDTAELLNPTMDQNAVTRST
jgi:hypothetical protein